MIVYPVLDLKGGLVVRGQGGDRDHYRPVQSCLVDSAEPVRVACAFRDHLGLDELYLADLDAIAGAPPAFETYRALRDCGFRLLVDAGIRSAREAVALASLGVDDIIAALETLPDPDALSAVVGAVGGARTVFSLDLKAGRLLGDPRGWPFEGPLALAEEAMRRGVERLLVLDLAQVGSGRGPSHLELLRHLSGRFPGTQLLSGGGVRAARDLDLFDEAGVHGVLVASALHDGSITRREIEGSAA